MLSVAWLLGVAATAAAQAPPPSAFPGEPPPSPSADILVFRAEPTADANGLQLRWEAINAYALEIVPGIGAVGTFGTRRIAPEQRTTYTLRVTGADGIVSESVTVEAAAATDGAATDGAGGPAAGGSSDPGGRSTAAAAESIGPSGSAGLTRLADGSIDLSGVYIGGRAVQLLGDVLLTPEAQASEAAQAGNDLGPGILCVPPGVPNATLMPFPLQLVHKEDLLVILYEAYHLFRIVPIGREHPDYLDPSWMGHSVAHWEGDTLVVEVRGFNDKSRIAGHRHSEQMTVTERYTRTDVATIRYEAVVEDPAVFAEPVRYAGDLTLRPEWEIGEYVCAENNKDYDALFQSD